MPEHCIVPPWSVVLCTGSKTKIYDFFLVILPVQLNSEYMITQLHTELCWSTLLERVFARIAKVRY